MKLNTQNTSELEGGQPQGYYYKEIQPKEENGKGFDKAWMMEISDLVYG